MKEGEQAFDCGIFNGSEILGKGPLEGGASEALDAEEIVGFDPSEKCIRLDKARGFVPED